MDQRNQWGLQVGDQVRVQPNKPTLGPANGIVTAIRDDGFDVLLEVSKVGGVLRESAATGAMPPSVLVGPVLWEDVATIDRQPATSFVRRYVGSKTDTARAFQEEAVVLGGAGYSPSTQSYTPGNWGCGAWVLAVLAVVFVVGIIALAYMIAVKPAGELVVTFAVVERERASVSADDTMPCPRCAETIKRAATMCRFCQLDLMAGREAR